MAVVVPSTPLAIGMSILALVIGLVLTFSGYRLAKSFATFAGFLAGLVIGWGIGAGYAPNVGVQPLLGAIVGAVLLGILLALVFRFAFRFAGAIVGVLAGIALATNLAWPIWGLVAAALVGATVGYFVNKIAIVSWTAIVGASLAVKSGVELFYAFSDYNLAMEAVSMLFSTILLAAVGVLSQMRSLRGEDETAAPGGSAS
ncbi:MAG TPA: hypothetical protein VM370_00145 [Candidatus Thermoplasmatota archaeon]|nr:hypothetical protein [Candidatus Thermoplasmatota archaeon]